VVVLYPFEYSVKANHQIKTIHEQSDPHKDNQRQLIIAERLSRVFIRQRANRPRDFAVPRNGRFIRTRDGGRKEIVEAERKGGRPGTDE
jgi:hypothetical protein